MMIKTIALALALMIPSASFADRGTNLAGDYDTQGNELRNTRAVFTSDVVEGILVSGKYESEELTQEEAEALAKERGVPMPAAPAGAANYGRPWVIVKAGIGLPNLLAAAVEIFVHRNVTVEVGAGVGLLPTVFEG